MSIGLLHEQITGELCILQHNQGYVHHDCRRSTGHRLRLALAGEIPSFKLVETELSFVSVSTSSSLHANDANLNASVTRSLTSDLCLEAMRLSFLNVKSLIRLILVVNQHGADHSEKMHELPDEYLADVMPIAKKIAIAQGVENYNILQVPHLAQMEIANSTGHSDRTTAP
jgi:diadenosine tetraphosphate (Ap4A) HIT family hydrolase